jgi:hypothetical protein
VLRAYQSATGDAPAWAAVTAAQPCPCCAAAAGCSVVEEGSLVHCRTQVSVWPMLGGGWLHLITSAESPSQVITAVEAPSVAAGTGSTAGRP